MRQRVYYIDMMRITACFLVVLTHSVMSNHLENGIWLGVISFVCSPSSEMFLMLSGAILLPVHTETRIFFKRRFAKLLPPMIFWSLFGIGLRYFQGTITFQESINKIWMLPFKPVEGVYWFLYVMVGLYLFAPFISHWLHQASKKEVELFLMIWVLNMFLPWMNLVFPGFYDQAGSYYWPFCYFGGFLGYWILGYYLKKYPFPLRSFTGCVIILLCIAYCCAVFILKIKNIDTNPYTDNLQIGSAVLIVFLFMIFKSISDSRIGQRYLNQKAACLAQYSFGIYLLHIYVVRDLVWNMVKDYRIYSHPVIESLLIAIVSMTFCVVFIALLSRLYQPVGRWLFGLNK